MNELKYLVIDVDGTMTDAGIYYDDSGNETKKFCTRDAVGFFAAKKHGIKTVVITGRECKATTRRLAELKTDYVFQNVKQKAQFLKEFMEENKIEKSVIGYIGDDLNDLQAMNEVGFVACPSDGIREVKDIANYISPVKGGNGVIIDVVRHLLEKYGVWQEVIADLYGGI